MSLKINAGDDVKRGEFFMVDPNQVKIVNDLRGREWAPSEDAIIRRASSMLADGQLQPVQARRMADKTLQLVFGFTRTSAARLIREGFTDVDGNFQKDENFLLKVIAVDGLNDEQAFIRNVKENAERNETSPIDDAHNQNRLRERYGKSDADIARIYGWNSSVKVGKLKQLLNLEREAQYLVHQGILGVDAAIALLQLEPADRQEYVAKATAEGKANGAEIVRQVREAQLRDVETVAEANAEVEANVADAAGTNNSTQGTSGKGKGGSGGGAKPLTLKEQRVFWTTLQDEEYRDEVRAFAKAMLAHLNGKLSDKALNGKLVKFGGLDSLKLSKEELEARAA